MTCNLFERIKLMILKKLDDLMISYQHFRLMERNKWYKFNKKSLWNFAHRVSWYRRDKKGLHILDTKKLNHFVLWIFFPIVLVWHALVLIALSLSLSHTQSRWKKRKTRTILHLCHHSFQKRSILKETPGILIHKDYRGHHCYLSSSKSHLSVFFCP